MTQDLGVGSHVPVLAAALARTTGPILECGMGFWSTPLIHMVANGRHVLSLETDASWSEQLNGFSNSWHHFGLIENKGHHPAIKEWEKLGAGLERGAFEVAFLDQSPGEARVPMAKALKGKVKFIVCHDTDADLPGSGGNYGWRELEGYFKYTSTFRDVRPWTTVYSDVEEFKL